MFDLVNIFEVFLPQLLRYPNPSDPLNREAASMLLENEENYHCRVREYVLKYAVSSNVTTTKDSPPRLEGENGFLIKEGAYDMTPCSTNSSSTSDNEKIGNNQLIDNENNMMDDFDEYASDVSDMSDL
jgi:hypothetical protein